MKQQNAIFEEAIKQKDASAEELKTHLAKEKEEHEKVIVSNYLNFLLIVLIKPLLIMINLN